MLQRLNDDIELHIIRGVPQSHVIQLFVEELDEVVILAMDTPYANVEGIACDFKHLAEVGVITRLVPGSSGPSIC